MPDLNRNTLSRSEYELKNEKNKAVVRWFLILVIGGYLSFLLGTERHREVAAVDLFNWFYIGGVTGAFAILNLLIAAYLRKVARAGAILPPALKYATTFVDFLAVSLVVLPTGGSESMLFVIYFIVIVSNGLRYGMRLALFGVFAFNILYVLVLIYQYFPGMIVPHMQREFMKVFGFWLVGLYVGYLARRFELLQGEVEKYRLLVEKLMAKRPEAP